MKAEHEQQTAATTQRETPARHGMAVVGQPTLFFSHLPEFEEPHNYQVIFEVSLAGTTSDPLQVYINDRKKHPQAKLYTFEPGSAFALPEIIPKDVGGRPALKSIGGNIYRGHFERFPTQEAKDKARILHGVTANIANVVHAHKFPPDAKPLDTLQYILFGKGRELILAHLITKPPDFDQLLSVQIAGHQPTDEELRRGIPVTVAGRSNSSKERIQEGKNQKISATIQVAGQNIPVQITPEVQFYFEENELAG
jgi:hypothetical protein